MKRRDVCELVFHDEPECIIASFTSDGETAVVSTMSRSLRDNCPEAEQVWVKAVQEMMKTVIESNGGQCVFTGPIENN